MFQCDVVCAEMQQTKLTQKELDKMYNDLIVEIEKLFGEIKKMIEQQKIAEEQERLRRLQVSSCSALALLPSDRDTVYCKVFALQLCVNSSCILLCDIITVASVDGQFHSVGRDIWATFFDQYIN